MAIYPDKKDGKLTGRFRVELQQAGKRYRKRHDTLREAQEDEKSVLATWARGETLEGSARLSWAPQAHTLSDVIDKARGSLWVGLSTEEVSFAHMATLAGIIGGNTKLDAIDTLAVDRVIKKLAQLGKADGTINRYLSHLRSFLAWAKGRKYRTVPLDEISFAWRKESAGRIRWVTADEEVAMQAFLLDPANLQKHPDYADVWDLIVVAIETGCRRTELLSAELDQISGTRLHLWKTKTNSPRTVPMSPEVTERLRSLIKRRAMPSVEVLRRRWDDMKKHMGLSDDGEFVFHTCRHTRATRMVDAGVNVFVIKEWMGHKTIETTLRYAHVKPQNLEDALVQVGDYRTKGLQKVSASSVLGAPPASPTAGVNESFRQAA